MLNLEKVQRTQEDGQVFTIFSTFSDIEGRILSHYILSH